MQARNFYPAFRVFVFGVEVTEDVLSVNVTWTDARQPGTAEIVLANKGKTSDGLELEDRYIVNEFDIHALNDEVDFDKLLLPDRMPSLAGSQVWQTAGQAFSNPATGSLTFGLGNLSGSPDLSDAYGKMFVQNALTADAVDRIVQRRIDRAVQDPLKATVLKTKTKTSLRQKLPEPDQRFGGPGLRETTDQIAAFRGTASRYPFQVGDCIFHSNDPVRIFFRDIQPNAIAEGPSRSFHMFAGFVSDSVDDVDENNQRTVTLRCEDVLRSLRYARMSTSPGFLDIQQAATEVDLALQSFFSEDFSADTTLTEFLFTMIFGFTTAGTTNKISGETPSLTGKVTRSIVCPNGSTQAQFFKDGVGFFNFDQSVIFVLDNNAVGPVAPLSTVSTLTGLEQPVSNLSVYQALVDNQVRSTDLTSMATQNATPIALDTLKTDPITGQVLIDEIVRSIGENPHIYPVDGGRLVMLAPRRLGTGYDVKLFFQDVKGVELFTSWTQRLSKIYDALERFEFSFRASPKGDLIAEMPLHDFDPVDFGTTPVTLTDLKRLLPNAVPGAQTLFDLGHAIGPFAPQYTIQKRDTIKWSRSFSDEQVRTLATCTYNALPGLQAAGTALQAGAPLQRRLLGALVPQFGVREIAAEPTVVINSPEAAEIYCQLLLNRTNANARQVSVEILPHLRLTPNRPVLFTRRYCVATTREVQHRIVWGEKGEMSTTLRVNYVRGWDGSSDSSGRPLYSYLGGFAANPMNYALLVGAYAATQSQAQLTTSTQKPLPYVPFPTPPDLVPIPGTKLQVRAAVAEAFIRMRDAYRRDNPGSDLTLSTAYRDFQTQNQLYNENHGVATARPGTSLHEQGIALDINVGSIRGTDASFIANDPNTPQFRWLLANSELYGFKHSHANDPPHFDYIGAL